MMFTSKALAILVASCLALNAMAQQCACIEQFDASESCLSFIEGGPACEAVTCNPYYVCNSEGSSLCEVSTTALTVIRLVEPGQCSTELVDPATVTTLVRSQTDFFSRTATADQTNPLATPNGAGPSVDMLVGFFYTETECTIEWSLVNLQGSSWTGPPDRAHIHGPAAEGSNAGVMVTIFNDPTLAIGTSLISGTNIVGSATVAQSICDTMYDGLAYINFHTAANPSGEARAQLLYMASVPLETSAGTDATGNADVSLGDGEVCVSAAFTMSNVPTNAHIHAPAPLGSNAGVIVPLFASLVDLGGNSYQIVGCFAVTDQQYGWIHDDLAYINVHTAENPGGELRGQITFNTFGGAGRSLSKFPALSAMKAL